MDVLKAEGISYFFGWMEDSGVIMSDDSNFMAFHSYESWEVVSSKFDEIALRHLVGEIKLVKTTKMKNGMNNYVFTVAYNYAD